MTDRPTARLVTAARDRHTDVPGPEMEAFDCGSTKSTENKQRERRLRVAVLRLAERSSGRLPIGTREQGRLM
jgi:hypothetical protein